MSKTRKWPWTAHHWYSTSVGLQRTGVPGISYGQVVLYQPILVRNRKFLVQVILSPSSWEIPIYYSSTRLWRVKTTERATNETSEARANARVRPGFSSAGLGATCLKFELMIYEQTPAVDAR